MYLRRAGASPSTNLVACRGRTWDPSTTRHSRSTMERRDESARDGEAHADPARDVVARILARSGHLPDPAPQHDTAADGEQLERDERAALRRAVGLSTELDDVHDVEYRQLRLERVVLVGLATTSAAEAE